ncbi:MAG: extracellular solute-binding protein [Pseudomonadota bacterium]|nr:extracellular solute-binding protein [Pseudomonadota bacterium]
MKHRRFTRRDALRSLAAIPAITMAPAALAQSGPDASLLASQAPDRADHLLAAAKKEGTFTWYTSFAEKDIPSVVEPFERKYGVKVRTWRASTEKVLQRTLTETAGRRYDVDLVHMSAPEMEALHREKVLQPVNSPAFKQLLPGALPAHREWVTTLLTIWVQAYNTTALKKTELPKTYRDLLDPRFKGKLGIEVEDQEWFSTVATSMGEQQGLQFFRELVAKNGISVRKGHTLLTNLVVSGEVPLALTVYNYMAEGAKRKGAPVDWFALDPAVARGNGQGIAARAPHPNAAALFYDYFLTEAQQYMTAMDYVPINSTVASPLKGIAYKIVDATRTLDEMDKWGKLYQDIIIKGSRA